MSRKHESLINAMSQAAAIIDETHVDKSIDSYNIIAFSRNRSSTQLGRFQFFLENGK